MNTSKDYVEGLDILERMEGGHDVIVEPRQSVSEAISVLISAADVRAEQWAGVANNANRIDLIQELFEADADEGGRMCDLIENAIGTLRDAQRGGNTYPEVTVEEALTAMCMQEWYSTANDFCREHYRGVGGASMLRVHFLKTAFVLDAAWVHAHNEYGYDKCFDWDFVPEFMEWAAQLSILPVDFYKRTDDILEAMGVMK